MVRYYALYNLIGGVNVRSIANSKKMTVKTNNKYLLVISPKMKKQEVLRCEY